MGQMVVNIRQNAGNAMQKSIAIFKVEEGQEPLEGLTEVSSVMSLGSMETTN